MIRFRRTAAVLASLAAMALAPRAFAQDATGASTSVSAVKDDGKGTNAEGLVEPAPVEPTGFLNGGGVKLTEGIVFHPLFELQTGYQTNVFFQDNSDAGGETASPLMRLLVGGGISTTPPQRLEIEAPGAEPPKPKLALNAHADLTWNQYLSGNNAVTAQDNLGIGLFADAKVNPQGTFVFQLKDGYIRSVLPPQSEIATDLPRDRNEATIGGIFQPGGGAIQAYANYTFGFDVFEKSEVSFADRSSHMFAVGGKWQWLPKTQFNAEANMGLVLTSSGAIKSDSTPLRVWVGTSTLITPTFGTVLRVGYGNGFYNAGASFNSYLALAEGRIAIGPTVRFAFGYTHDFTDSIIANYYADHALYARFSSQIGGRTQLRARAELRFRDYAGVPMMAQGVRFCGNLACSTSSRSDVIGKVDATLEYQLNAWLFIAGAYSFYSDTTDFYIMAGGQNDSGGFVWHELLAKLTAKF